MTYRAPGGFGNDAGRLPIQMQLDGVRSRVTIPGTLELALAPMINPVTGEEEPATLMKPKGFTAQVQELCATAVLRFSKEGLSYDHSGKYGGSVASSTKGLDSGV